MIKLPSLRYSGIKGLQGPWHFMLLNMVNRVVSVEEEKESKADGLVDLNGLLGT